jgi:hypothetical protein
MIVRIPKPDKVFKYVALIITTFISAGYLLITGRNELANQFFWLAVGLALVGIVLAPLLENDNRLEDEKYWEFEITIWQTLFPHGIRNRFRSFFNDKETKEEKGQKETPVT